jgi:hypothetical protein
MSFSLQGLERVNGGLAFAATLWSYTTADDIASVEASDYFAEAKTFKVGDCILAVASDAARFYRITLLNPATIEAINVGSTANDPFTDPRTYANFAALPDVAANNDKFAVTLSSQGVWMINYKAAGLYYSNGTVWVYQGDYTLTDTASEIAFTPAAGLVSVNVQDAIEELAGDNTVTNAKLADMAGHTVKARVVGSSGDPTDLAMGSHSALVRNGGDIVAADAAVNTVLRRNSGNTLEFGAIGTAHLESSLASAISAAGDASGPASSTDNAIARFDGTGGKSLQNSGVTIGDNGEVLLAAGGASDAPLKFTAGTNLTTAEAGAIEYNGGVFYSTPIAGARGVSPSTMFAIVPAGGFALGTAAGVQSCFPVASEHWLLAANTTYLMEGLYHIQKAVNSVEVAMAFGLGSGASVTSIKYYVVGHNSAANVVATAQRSCYVTTVAETFITSTSSTHTIHQFKGILRMNAGGYVTPQISFSADAAGTPTMMENSYIMFTPLGTGTVESVGSATAL